MDEAQIGRRIQRASAGFEQPFDPQVGLERFVEREVEVHGPAQARACDARCALAVRRAPGRLPACGDARLARSLARERDGGRIGSGLGHVAERAHVRAVRVQLVARLRRAQALQSRRTVARQHDERHA